MGVDFSSFMTVEAQIPSDVCGFVIMQQKIFGINVPTDIKEKIHESFKAQPIGETTPRERTDTIRRYSLKPSIIQSPYYIYESSVYTKSMFCRTHKLFCEHGWSLLCSPILSYRFTISSWLFYKDINPLLKTKGSINDLFCAIGIAGNDGLQCVFVPDYVVNEMRKTIQNAFPSDLNVSKPRPIGEEGCVQFELGGKLWIQQESIEAREVLLIIIKIMYQNNWELVNSTLLQPSAPDTLFFRQFVELEEKKLSFGNSHFLLGIMKPNWICILGLKHSDRVREIILASLERNEKIQNKTVKKRDRPSIEMEVDIFCRTTTKEIVTKKTLTLLFQDLAAYGWLVTESVEYGRSVHDINSFVFRHVKPLRRQFCCIMPQKTNQNYSYIYLINTPIDVIDTCHKAIQEKLGHTTMSKTHDYARIQFVGNGAYDTLNTKSKIVFIQAMLSLTSELRKLDWYLTVSGDSCIETVMEGEEHKHAVRYTIYSLWFSKVIKPTATVTIV